MSTSFFNAGVGFFLIGWGSCLLYEEICSGKKTNTLFIFEEPHCCGRCPVEENSDEKDEIEPIEGESKSERERSE
jgi:hypothetical protein